MRVEVGRHCLKLCKSLESVIASHVLSATVIADSKNQIVLGIFVATFVYCIIVLNAVYGGTETAQSTVEAFVPQITVVFAYLLTLTAVGALIAYIHHNPESINIINLTSEIGDKLQRAVTRLMDDEHQTWARR